MTRAALALLLVAVVACHRHRDTNAPGLLHVETPPPDPTSREPMIPGDPGEHMLTINPGILAAGGARNSAPNGFGEFGVEVTVNRGETPYSHGGDSLFVYPLHGWGATAGWSALRLFEGSAGDTDAQVGPLYAEVQAMDFPWAGGVGYAVDPLRGHHGPQVFTFLMLGYVRARYLVDSDDLEVSLGVQLKLPRVWVWSR